MENSKSLSRFLQAQQTAYQTALAEVSAGRKRSHWMWFIFPQIKGLGVSGMAQHYAIRDLSEAEAYLKEPTLGRRLIEISNALLRLQTSDANQVFGTPDDMKLRSCMTLFATVPGADDVFEQVIEKFFGGRQDERTLRLLKQV